jgi:enoyl-CoA hydratase/carnithine racemase
MQRVAVLGSSADLAGIASDESVLAVVVAGTFPADVGAIDAIAALPVPTIAAIDGPLTGIGAELVLACDLRIASDSATFQFPDLPGAGGTQRLPRIVGRAHALELLLLGEKVSAIEAHRIGLVSRVVPKGQAFEEAQRVGERIADKAPIAVRYLREAVQKGMDLTLDQGLRLEADLYFLLQTTADRVEGIRAFLEKRPPRFIGE